MHCSFSPAHWLVFDARGLLVDGQHTEDQLPVHPEFQADFSALWPSNRERILATLGGFEGACAALLGWSHTQNNSGPARLSIATGFRPYTHSNTLKKLMGMPHAARPLLCDVSQPSLQPIPSLSWGSSLTTLVLLAHDRILMGQRSVNMDANPGAWSGVFTEIIEPKDVVPETMAPLLARLVHEELPAFTDLGKHRFVGLLLVPSSYTWTLVSVLDLRSVERACIEAKVGTLVPDAETQAWCVHDLRMPFSTPHGAPSTQGLALARDIATRLQ